MRELLDIDARSVKTKSPLHYAVAFLKGDEHILKLLSEAYATASYALPLSVLPLHLAISTTCSEKVVIALANAYPESVRHQYPNGDLPIHVVVQNEYCSAVTIDHLARTFPNGLNKQTKN